MTNRCLGWATTHCWLCTASGGVTTCPWRWLAAAVYAAFFVAGNDVEEQKLIERALHLTQIAGCFQVAIDHGLKSDDLGSLLAALSYFVSFCRSIRASHRDDFTIDDATAFFSLPGGGTLGNPPDECLWFHELTDAYGCPRQ